MMPTDDVSALFDAFSGLRILVIGDVMLDAYSDGKVERISPEAPVPVVHISREEKRLGGAANVACNLRGLGAEPVLCSVIGTDAASEEVLRLLDKEQLESRYMVRDSERPTTVKHRILSGSQHILRIDSETQSNLSESIRAALLQRIREAISDCRAVVFEDYDKGVIDQVLIAEVIAWAKAIDIPVIVDPKKRNFHAYRGTTFFKPNLKELREGTGTDLHPDRFEEFQTIAEAFREKMGFTAMMVTLSEKGVYITDGVERHLLPAHVREISDVTGAGDTVTAAAAVCTALKLPIRTTAGLSNLAGGLACEHVGVYVVTGEQLKEEAKKEGILSVKASL